MASVAQGKWLAYGGPGENLPSKVAVATPKLSARFVDLPRFLAWAVDFQATLVGREKFEGERHRRCIEMVSLGECKG